VSFHTIPHPLDLVMTRGPKDAWKTANLCQRLSGPEPDPERGIVYLHRCLAGMDLRISTAPIGEGNTLFGTLAGALDAIPASVCGTSVRWHTTCGIRDSTDATGPRPVRRDGRDIPQ